MNVLKGNKFSAIAPILFLLIFLIIGNCVYEDFGAAWDEETQLNDIGRATAEFIKSGDSEKFLKNPEKYHGPSFELVLYYLQEAFSVKDMSSILLFRHLVSYLLFWVSGVFLYFLLKSRYNNSILVLIGLMWYFIMPRIFADSFYNSKDIPLLSMSVMVLWAMDRFFKNPTLKISIVLGLFCGFMIAIRIIGIIFPLATIGLLLFSYFINNDFMKYKLNTRYILPLTIFFITTIGFTIICWPVLWLGPLEHFMKAWKEMSAFHWEGAVRYMNKSISSKEVPWHYNFVWIGVTTPIFYSIFFIIGTVTLLYRFLSFKPEKINPVLLEIGCVVLYFLPILMIIYFESVVYDAWRHIFMIYSSFILVSLAGINEVLTRFNGKWQHLLIIGSIFLFTGLIGVKMITMHPYENVYFNSLSGVHKKKNHLKFELDYWGLTYKEALQKLINSVDTGKINVFVPAWPGFSNANMLSKKDRERLQYVEKRHADYFITNYRWDEVEVTEYEKIDSIMVDGIDISGTFKLKPGTIEK